VCRSDSSERRPFVPIAERTSTTAGSQQLHGSKPLFTMHENLYFMSSKFYALTFTTPDRKAKTRHCYANLLPVLFGGNVGPCGAPANTLASGERSMSLLAQLVHGLHCGTHTLEIHSRSVVQFYRRCSEQRRQ
jgi:hypothetical protein